jgi:dephospho-CoA kinase
MKIAITGKMCYGKTTVANIIKEYDDEYQIFSFGQKVKDIATDLFDMQNKDRTLLTSIGTKMREIDSDIWAKYIIKSCRDLENVVIDDLRYQNEYRYLIENNFKIIVLTLPVEIQIKRIKELYPENYQDHLNNMFHVSEKGIDFIDNDYLNIDMSQDIETIQDIIYKYLMT